MLPYAKAEPEQVLPESFQSIHGYAQTVRSTHSAYAERAQKHLCLPQRFFPCQPIYVQPQREGCVVRAAQRQQPAQPLRRVAG